MKIGALIPIRLSSERLPGKALKLIQGRPAVKHLLDRAFESKYLDKKRGVVNPSIISLLIRPRQFLFCHELGLTTSFEKDYPFHQHQL